MILPILDWAVSDGVNFGEACCRTEFADHAAKTIDIGCGGGSAGAGRGTNPGHVGRPPRTCNCLNFGLDCAIVDNPYDLSYIGKDMEKEDKRLEEGSSSANGSFANYDGKDDLNKDECVICGNGVGVL